MIQDIMILAVPVSGVALVVFVWGLSAWLDRHEEGPNQDAE